MQEAVITGTIDNWTPTSHLYLNNHPDSSSPFEGGPRGASIIEIPVSPDGSFSMRQPIERPTVATLNIKTPSNPSLPPDATNGSNLSNSSNPSNPSSPSPLRLSLYLEADKTINVDLRHVQSSSEGRPSGASILPTFSGDTRAECEFVNDNTSIDPRHFDTFTAFKDSVDRFYADRLKRAQAIGNPAFVDDYIAINDPISRNARLVNYISHDANLDSVETAYTDFINSLDFNDPVNEDALHQYLITYGRFVQRKNLGGSATMPALEELTRRTSNQAMLDHISSRLMYFFLMIDTPYVESVWAKYNTICKDKALIDELRPRYNARSKELKKTKAQRPH